MANQNVQNGWLLGVDLDIKPFKDKVKLVEDIFDKLNNKQSLAANSYQKILDKQLETLQKQKAIIDKIQGKVGVSSSRTGSSRSSSGGAAPYSSIRTRRNFEANLYNVEKDLTKFESGLERRIGTSQAYSSIAGSVRKLRGELSKANDVADLRRIRGDLRRLTAGARQAEMAIRAMRREAEKSKFVSNSISSSVKNLARSYLSVYLAIRAVGAVYNSIKQLSVIESTLLASSGSAEQAAKDFEFLRQTSMKLGTDLRSSSKAYTQLAVAGHQANLTAEQTKNIFLAAQEASTSFGLSADDAGGVIRALTQALSKNQLMAEEVRQQLGDRLPVAVPILAKSLGVTTKELSKMMERGELVASEVLPKFAEELRKAARAGGALAAGMNNIQAQENRLKTALTTLSKAFAEGGGRQVISETLKELADIIGDLGPFVKGLGYVFKDFLMPILNALGLAFKAIVPTLNLVGDLLIWVGDSLDVMFGNFDKGVRKLTDFELLLRDIGRALQTLSAPIKIIVEALDVLNDFASKEGWLSTIGNVLLGTEKGKGFEKQMNAEMLSRLKGTPSTLATTNNMSRSATNNMTVQYNINSNDPKAVADAVGDRMQFVLKSMAVSDF